MTFPVDTLVGGKNESPETPEESLLCTMTKPCGRGGFSKAKILCLQRCFKVELQKFPVAQQVCVLV